MKILITLSKQNKCYFITNSKRLAMKIHTAAFIDKNNKINTNISQNTSQQLYNIVYEAMNLKYALRNNSIIDDAMIELNYQIINNIGLYGETFIDKHNNQVTMELQLGKITNVSEEYATKLFDEATLQYYHQQQDNLYEQFENELNKIYYLAVILIKINNTIDQSKNEYKFFTRNTNLTEIKQYIINYIAKYK